MIGVKTPSSLNEYANLITTYDNDLRYLPRRSSPSRPSRPSASRLSRSYATASLTPRDPDAMDLDKIDRGYARVGSEERQRRFREGRCFKCGSKNHISPACSVPIPRSRLESASTSPSRGRSSTTRSSPSRPTKTSPPLSASPPASPRTSGVPRSTRSRRLSRSDSSSESSLSDSTRSSRSIRSSRLLKGRSRA